MNQSNRWQSPTIGVAFALFAVWMERKGRWVLFANAIAGKYTVLPKSAAVTNTNTASPGFTLHNGPVTPYSVNPGESTAPNPGFGSTYPSLLTPGKTIG